MSGSLEGRFGQLEQEKAEFVTRVAGWGPERLRFQPAAGEWCAVEVFDHVARTEWAILQVMKRGVDDAKRIGITDRWRTKFLDSVFRSERRVKTPGSAKQVFPDAGLEFAEVLRRWDRERGELREFLHKTSAEQLAAGIFKHPVGGWMNAEGVLGFFSVHILHHGFQLERIDKAFRESGA